MTVTSRQSPTAKALAEAMLEMARLEREFARVMAVRRSFRDRYEVDTLDANGKPRKIRGL